jgi:membrane protease subunit HflK
VRINQVAIQNAQPPTEVADAFDEVQRAEQDEDRFQEEARQYANTKLGAARGQAAQIRENAAAYKDRVVKEAQGEVAHFNSVYQEYARAPEVTRERLYLETMEQVLGGAHKVIVDQSATGGIVPYLPLPQLNPGTPAPKARPGSVAPSSGGTSGLPTIMPSNSGISNAGAPAGSPDGMGN